ncbi:MAG TPA: hypothetical protein VF647_09625 [Longimicrobium sp.]|jgi:CubicO group peptidase (beta-lactamase class C family)
MKKRMGINLLAAAIIAAGGLSLTGVTPAQAATVVGGCENMLDAIAEHAQDCWDMGGTRMTYTGSCSSEGYTLETSCYLQ